MSMKQRFAQQSDIRYPKVQLLQIDVTDKVMATIGQRQPRVSKKKTRLAIGMMAIIVLACGFGYASSAWKLFDADGSVALEYRAFMPGDELVSDVDVDELRALIPAGEAALFYLKQNDSFISIANEQPIASYEPFRLKAGRLAPPGDIGEGFVYSQAIFHNEYILDMNLMEELKHTAPLSSDPYQYGSVQMGEVSGYSVIYTNEEGTKLFLSGLYGERWATVYSGLQNEAITKLELGEREALYVVNQQENSHKIVWRDTGASKPIYYKLQAPLDGEVTAEVLENAALNMMTHG